MRAFLAEKIQFETRVGTRGEEMANAASALIGVAAVLAAVPWLLGAAERSTAPHAVVSVWVFITSLVALYVSSTIYHALRPGRAKDAFRLLDHISIFLLIAGSYTPFALGPLREAGGVALLVTEWALAAAGILFKVVGGFRLRAASHVIYLGMGWACVFWVSALLNNVPMAGLLWLLAGGLAYTGGVAFYIARHRAYAHFIWHLFVFAGTCCHLYAVGRYAFR